MKICVLSLNSFGILSDDNGSGVQHVGGAETQIVAVGEGLARRGHDVNFICLDHGQADEISVPSGIRVFKSFNQSRGWRGIRFVWPRITSVWSALSRVNADVCLQACSDSWTGVAAAWCRRYGRKFVFVVMSNADCDRQLPFLKTRRERIMCRYGLRRSDAIVAQTEVQRDMLSRNYGLHSSVVRPCSRAAGLGSCDQHKSGRRVLNVLWVGRFDPEKRPEWFLSIAEKCPDLEFHMVGRANKETAYSRDIESRAAMLSNVVMHGYVRHDAMTGMYGSCGILVCTSICEGFPTTFIEAWAHGVPTVTTFDPDGVVAGNEMGCVGRSIDELVAGILTLSSQPDDYGKVSHNVRDFYERNHDVDKVAASFEQVIMRTGLCA